MKYKSLKEEFPIRIRPTNSSVNLNRYAEKGDELVRWVQDILLSVRFENLIAEVIDISGISNSIYDLLVKLKTDDTIRGLQIKTLSKQEHKWSVRVMDQSYPLDTLMIFVNTGKTKFVVGFWKDFTVVGGSIKCDFTVNRKRFTTDQKIFELCLAESINKSAIVEDVKDTILAINQIQEYSSIRMIKKVFEEKGMKFEYHWTGDSPIDIYLNDHTCQCKSSTYKEGQMNIFEASHMVNGTKIPYTSTDVEFFILNIWTEKYREDVCIIPINTLIDQKRVKTDTCDGQYTIRLAPPNHYEYHWSESLWNNFDLINKPQISDAIYQFILHNKCCVRNSSNMMAGKYRYLIRDYDFKQDYFLFFINNKKTRLYKNYVFCIPTKDMIKADRVPAINRSTLWISIVPPDSLENYHWSSKYWRKVDTLMDIIKSPRIIEILPLYKPIQTNNSLLLNMDKLQHVSNFLEDIIIKYGLNIDYKKICHEISNQCDDDPNILVRESNILQATNDKLLTLIKSINPNLIASKI